MLITIPYNRERAVAYAVRWAYGRNPDFFNFDDLGGDCTNFASQCIYAGCGVMNFTPVYGWYYINANDRTASWTGVEYLYNFLTSNEGTGPFAREADRREIVPGDIVQLQNYEGRFYHTPVVVAVRNNRIYVAAHSNDVLYRPLSTYNVKSIRYIHIEGARIEENE